MRKSTMIMGECKAVTNEPSEVIQVDNCKGGYFSVLDDFGLKVCGKTEQNGTPTLDNPISIQCVKQGTKLSVYGKNLYKFPYNSLTAPRTVSGVTITPNPDGSITFNGTCTTTSSYVSFQYSSIPVLPNTKYTFSARYDKSFIGNIHEQPQERTSGGSWVENINMYGYTKRTFTTSATTRYLWLQTIIYKDASFDNVTMYPQLEFGTTMTDWQPYQYGGTVTVPCDLYEGDIYYPMTGKVVKKWGSLTLNGTESWYLSSGAIWVNPNCITFWTGNNYGILNTQSKPVVYCDKLKASTMQNINTSSRNQIVLYSDGSEFDLKIDKDSIPGLTTSALWKQYLQQNNLTIYYIRATPITEQYDPQPIFTPQGYMQIIQTPTDLYANLQATVLVKE